MSPKTKPWILLRSYNIPPPPDGPLHLGSIITNPVDPISSNLTYLNIDVPLENVHETVQHEIQEKSESRHAKLFGLLGSQLTVTELNIERLVTTFIDQTQQYLDEVTSDAKFRDFIRTANRRTGVYMVTGLKIARGINFKEKKSRKDEKRLEVAVPVSKIGVGLVDLEVGVTAERTVRNEHTTCSSGLIGVPSDIVFAIRVVKVKYSGPLTSYIVKVVTPQRVEVVAPQCVEVVIPECVEVVIPECVEVGRAQSAEVRAELEKEEMNIEELEKELARRKALLKTQKADMERSMASSRYQERPEKENVDGIQVLPSHVTSSNVESEQERPIDEMKSMGDEEGGNKVQEPPSATEVKSKHPLENEHQIDKPLPAGEESSNLTPEIPSQVSTAVGHVEHHTSRAKLPTDSPQFGTNGEGDHKVQELPLPSRPTSTAAYIEPQWHDNEGPTTPPFPTADADNDSSDADSTHSPAKSSASCGLACFGEGLRESAEQRETRQKDELFSKVLANCFMDD